MKVKKHGPMFCIWYILLTIFAVLTVLYFYDIKFVVAGKNIFVWDVIIVILFLFAKSFRRVEGPTKLVAVPLVLVFISPFARGLLAFADCFDPKLAGKIPICAQYEEVTEHQTHRTFVAEYHENLLKIGRVELYERFGPFIVSCDAEYYMGELMPDEGRAYISKDRKSIIVSFFSSESEAVYSIELEG